MTEATTLNNVLLACSRGLTRLFRNNSGVGWVGTMIRRISDRIILKNPRPLHAGLHQGSADLIGWHSYTIQPDDVGCTVAVFLSVETKSATGRMREGQPEWQAAVQRAGGIGLVVRSVDEVQRGIQDYRPLRPAVQPEWPATQPVHGDHQGAANMSRWMIAKNATAEQDLAAALAALNNIWNDMKRAGIEPGEAEDAMKLVHAARTKILGAAAEVLAVAYEMSPTLKDGTPPRTKEA